MYTALIVLFFSVGMLIDIVFGVRRMHKLQDYSEVPLTAEFPSLSIVFAARNEERNIEHAVRSLLNIDYPNLEITAVNDRSTDSTATILKKLSLEFPKLKLITIHDLPKGWLGKNHALYQGIKQSQSELILLTDADIHFEKSALKRAVNCLQTEKLDHVTIMPQMKVPGFFLNLMIGVFGLFFYTYLRPWKAQDPKSKYFLGIGAFNLIKRSTYESIGTFEKIKLRPDDDLKLGKLVKINGFRQMVLRGSPLLSVEWYASVKEFVKGLEKNMYAGADYRFFFLLLSALALILTYIFPYVMLVLTTGLVFKLFAASIGVQLITYLIVSQVQKTPLSTFVGFPIGAIFYLYVMWNSILKTIFNNGIEWRGTFYPLDELKKNKI